MIIIVNWGILPAVNNTEGDFANYYTASRLVADGISLETAYRDFVWFQKQMDKYGIVNQVGGFIPHPPSTALLFLPLTSFSPVTAKNIWILINMILVVFDILLLCKIARQHWLITSVLFCGSGYALLNNFLFGQQYLLLITSILLSVYFHQKKRMILSGIALGSLIPIKYVGVLFLLYFSWKKQWQLVITAVMTIMVILLATVWLCDFQVFQTFAAEVLPRHLRGEIQDPFAVFFQSWNSLFRRLFVYQASLNANPPLPVSELFFISRNLVSWSILGLSIFILSRTRFPHNPHEYLFHMGFIPLVLLLISPGSATYHFLLLTLSCVFFVKILMDGQKVFQAAYIGGLFIMINLPHFMKLLFLADGWLTPLAYPRLWLLSCFFISVLVLFRKNIGWQPFVPPKWVVSFCIFVLLLTTRDIVAFASQPQDGAHYLPIDEPAFQHHLGLVLNKPDLGRQSIVFSYCELMNENYAIYGHDGLEWTPVQVQNYYNPDLYYDDSALLVESVVNGHIEIWMSKRRGEKPAFVQVGRSPSWHPNSRSFAFFRDDGMYLFNMEDETLQKLDTTINGYDLKFSPDGRSIIYCTQDALGTQLNRLDTDSGNVEVLLQSPDRIESPDWSPDGGMVLFCWNRTGNRDIWALDVLKRTTYQLTSNQAADTDPIWDAEQQRILFVSDRGRGLEFSTLYWLPIPEDIQ